MTFGNKVKLYNQDLSFVSLECVTFICVLLYACLYSYMHLCASVWKAEFAVGDHP